MDIKEYFYELWNIFVDNIRKIAITTFSAWIVLPVLMFVLYSIIIIIFGIQNLNFDIFTKLFSDALIPWFASLILNPLGEVIKMIIIGFLVTNYFLWRKYNS